MKLPAPDDEKPAALVRLAVDSDYPKGDAEDVLLKRILALGARGFTLAALARQLRIPLKTLNAWAAQPNGARLRDVLSQVPDLFRGHFENEARRNVGNKNFNSALFGKITGAHFDEYRSVAQPLPSDAPSKPEGMSDFEFERRLQAGIERIIARRVEKEAAQQLPAKVEIDHNPEEKFH